MENKSLIIFGIIVLILIGIFILPKSLQLYSVHFEQTDSSCESYRRDFITNHPDLDCVMPCFKMTSDVESCVESFGGLTSYSDNIDEWLIVYSYADSCLKYFSERISDARYGALYSCVPALEEYISACPSGKCLPDTQTCNTNADTNCDNKVSDSEILAYMTKWINNQITDSEILSGISAWVQS